VLIKLQDKDGAQSVKVKYLQNVAYRHQVFKTSIKAVTISEDRRMQLNSVFVHVASSYSSLFSVSLRDYNLTEGCLLLHMSSVASVVTSWFNKIPNFCVFSFQFSIVVPTYLHEHGEQNRAC
jgi:hypothetical protein